MSKLKFSNLSRSSAKCYNNTAKFFAKGYKHEGTGLNKTTETIALATKNRETSENNESSLHFLPTIEIDSSGDSTRIARNGMFYGVFLFVGFLIWGLTAPISGAVITDGIIKIDFNRKTIQHLEGGIIKEINIREGSFVKKGQTLLILEDVNTSSQVNILTDRFQSSIAKESRLTAQKNYAKEIIFTEELLASTDENIKSLLSNETELFNSKRKSYLDQVGLLKQEIQQTKKQIKGLANEVEAIKASIGYIKKSLRASTNLQKKGYGEQSKIWDHERLLAERREKIGAKQAENSVAESKIIEIQLRIITLKNSYTQEADDQLKEVQKELLEIQELLRPAQYAYDRSIVIAPLEGQVINLQVNTIGGVIQPGADLMEIIPNNNELIIEAKINTGDIDNVHLNQAAHIQLSAYNRRTTPLLEGNVIYISGDVIEDTINRGEFYYLCHIEGSAASLKELPENIILFPGMPITAFIQTRARTFIDFILEPIVDNMRRSLRED
ncbi:MAG TPA: HlyD family type I secretion periplasmic adaptor subunit [Methyloprofundus sp.]|nr:HlyD family type I secretion periplasmic adaptor subunit [Methyloprofundus sp.]HIL77998.1 HlyD family type I secretion periplasmic adaptor subunit [Methylococcales bacterium]